MKLDGLAVVSIGPIFRDEFAGIPCLHCYAVLPKNGGQEFASTTITLSTDQDPFVAQVNRTAIVCSLECLFWRVHIFGDELAFAKYFQTQWSSKIIDTVVATIVRNRGLN